MFKLKGKVTNILLILVIGGLGGLLADNLLLPYLATVPPFSKIEFFRHAGNGTTIINPTEKIIITENTALEEAIDKINPCLVTVQSYQNKILINQGTGFIITSDGLIITAADLISSRTDNYWIIKGGDYLSAQMIKRDLENNLALLRIEQDNLPVVSLVEPEDLRLGQRVVLAGVKLGKDELDHFISLGTIRSISNSTLKLNLIEEETLANGGPLINIKGEVIGLNLIGSRGLTETIPSSIIKDFININ